MTTSAQTTAVETDESTPVEVGAVKPDATLAKADGFAREALVEFVDPAEVGDYLGHHADDDNVLSHFFSCTKSGYVGWQWSVTLVRVPRSRHITINEVVLLPGADAIVAPGWVPYRERIRPGDLSPGDMLPVEDDDPRLVPTYSFGDDPLDPDDRDQIREVAADLGLGRIRTLSVEGRDLAAQRWYDGDGGPEAPLAKSAPSTCTSCGFLLRIAGPLSELFGVCANGNANDDGRVVSFDHGCGAHSEVRLSRRNQPQPLPEHVHDSEDDLEGF